jgi:hypothetical protein
MSVSPVTPANVPFYVTLAKLSGTRMMTDASSMGVYYPGDWNYAELCDSTWSAYNDREMSGKYESITFYTYLSMLSELVRKGAKDGSSVLHRSHCTAMSVMFEDMMTRIDRECAELSALLNSDIWNERDYCDIHDIRNCTICL